MHLLGANGAGRTECGTELFAQIGHKLPAADQANIALVTTARLSVAIEGLRLTSRASDCGHWGHIPLHCFSAKMKPVIFFDKPELLEIC